MEDDADSSFGKGSEVEDVVVADAENPEFPGYTVWEYTKCCCTNKAIQTLPKKVLFLGHWEVQPGFPIAVYTIILTSYLLAMFGIYPYFGKYGIPCSICLSFLCFMFCYSYGRTIIDGPGYYPFYFPMGHDEEAAESDSLLGKNDHSPSGIVSTQAQIDWVKTRPRPARCIFSTAARRYVIRPDHLCGWTSSWIGKRNHKFFILFNLWGFLYIAAFTASDILILFSDLTGDILTWSLVFYLIYSVLGICFGIMTFSFAMQHIVQAMTNVTSWEEWNNISRAKFQRGGCKENMEDVCGPSNKWYLYLCPVSPWLEMTNDEIIAEYPHY